MRSLKVLCCGGAAMSEFERCLNERKISTIKASKEMIENEVSSAEYDLNRSKGSLANRDYKWASVQAYYSMFHSAKALVLNKGYREKSHYCLLVALRELYIETGQLDKEFADNFEMCMDIRQEADYGLTYSSRSAELSVESAEKLLKVTKNILS
jgi:uncharacterized protein (UPF0332 family)